jgi:hypothetical protein
MIGFRFGTTIGISPVQRTNLFAIAFARAVSEVGFMRVVSPLSVRPVLHLKDLHRVIRAAIAGAGAQRFDVFNVASFHSSMSRFANEISFLSGAASFEVSRQQASEHSFRIDCTRFESLFSFKFVETIESTSRGLLERSEQLSTSTYKQLDGGTANSTCVVCGRMHLESVLDLGHQPLANAFVSDPNLALGQQPHRLHLVSCPACNHVQLSTTVNRSLLFKHYLYESGTSRTLIGYFKWFAQKVVRESEKPTAGLVIEIAHNDGSQLDQFKDMGWVTHGVDPAENLAAKARAGGHVVHTAFWGFEAIPGLPAPDEVDAIIAQNVLAHVENVTQFMMTCASAMGARTRLYIQTSQCEMFETGQFDTVYHEHVSFFTAHSFYETARLSNLEIVNFETTPIHGKSCLVTFMKAAGDRRRALPAAFQIALDAELSRGLTDGRLLANFKREALGTRAWMHELLQSLAGQGFKIVAYGAAAKGMVLLHFLRQLQRSYDFDFIVDDAPLKQGTYCPGTTIPVLPAANISWVPPDQPLAIVVMPWNFLEEITLRIQNLVQFPRKAPVLLVVPFPHHKLLQLEASGPPTEVLPPTPPTLPFKLRLHDNRIHVGLLAQIDGGDEEIFRSFIEHHSPMFDFAVVVDRSASVLVQTIFEAVAPSSWKMTKDPNADAFSLFEKGFHHQTTRIITLRAHHFLVHPDFRTFIRNFTGHSMYFPVVRMSDKGSGSSSGACLNPLCRRTFAASAADRSRVALVQTSQLFVSGVSLSDFLQSFANGIAEQEAAAASASEGFIADLKVSAAEDDAAHHIDLSSVGIESDVLQQAHSAWFQVHNQALRLGCRGCRDLKANGRGSARQRGQ